MNILIIISFILIFTSSFVLLYPKKVALRISGINRYDLRTVPSKYVAWVYIIASLVLTVFMGILIFELKGIISPVPAFIESFLEWVHGL